MDFEVRRDDLRATRVTDGSPPDPEEGQAVLRVSQFALTANNVTYAVFGDAMSYWRFFPAEDGWGRVPVWGYADVEASRVAALPEGERIYGYLPMATQLVVTPERLSDAGFVDGASHRADLPAVYNQYQRVAADPNYDRAREREHAILRPLFMTSFLIDDWLVDSGMFGARSVVLASASSKTALGLAFLLSARDGIDVVGLTSPGNADFVRSVGYYDRTVVYDDIGQLPTDQPTAFVDMAGGGRVLGEVHGHLRDALMQSCLVGATHWEEGGAGPPADLPGPAPSFFFAPDRVVKRRSDWGPGGIEARVTDAWEAFLGSVDGWLEVVARRGPDELTETWLEVLEGRTSPEVGYVVSLPGT